MSKAKEIMERLDAIDPDSVMKHYEDAAAHDHSKEVSMSAYDLLPEEDRKAIAWVREKGGVNALSMGFQDADNRRIELCSSLGIDLETGWANAMVAMRRRLMPEGMEWPKVDGKPVDFVTGYEPSLGVLEVVSIYSNGACEVMSHDGIIRGVKGIHISEPKALDADGVEVRVGDVLYRKSDGHMVKVVEVYEKTFTDADDYVRPGEGYTHRAPVFAADGRPLHEGEHVYHVETGAELVVKELPKPGEYQAVVVFAPPARHLTSFDPDQLTHERPVADTWERLEEDAGKEACEYFAHMPCGCETSEMLDETVEKCNAAMARDLVRRAKKLAGVS